jgi:hypothetical protein
MGVQFLIAECKNGKALKHAYKKNPETMKAVVEV